MESFRVSNQSLKYKRFTQSGGKDIWIRKFGFQAGCIKQNRKPLQIER